MGIVPRSANLRAAWEKDLTAMVSRLTTARSQLQAALDDGKEWDVQCRYGGEVSKRGDPQQKSTPSLISELPPCLTNEQMWKTSY